MTPAILIILFLIRVEQNDLLPSPPHSWMDCRNNAGETCSFVAGREASELTALPKQDKYKDILYCHSKMQEIF